MFGKLKILIVIGIIFGLCGCSIILQKRNPKDLDRIDALSGELEKERQAREELLRAKKELEEQLKKEIEEKMVRLDMAKKGLVITFVAEVLFDSGKAQIKQDAYSVLDKVSDVLQNQVRDRNIAIEGYTDNQPIKYSKWKSNWELSTARATSVLHYLADKKGLDQRRLSSIGYGEFRPVASNNTAEGRQQNRRVEITILPEEITKLKPGEETAAEEKTLLPQAGELK